MKCEKIYLKDYYDFLGSNDKNPYVELFLPLNMDKENRKYRKRPCVIVCPGGAYRGCAPCEAEPIAVHFLTEGFNVFLLNYSTSPYAHFPTQLCEIAATMELIYKNQNEWNCDVEKTVIIGFSAGGHLAAHYSTMYDCKEVREFFPDSKPISATVLGYPVITAYEPYWNSGSIMNLAGKKEFTEDERQYFSCEKNVKQNTPPAFIWHTAEDDAVSVMNSLLYAEALSYYKIPYELHIYPFGFHGLSTVDETSIDGVTDKISHIDWLTALKKWLKIMGIKY